MNRTYEAIKEKYSWPHMKQEVEYYVKKCEKCQLNKLLRPKTKAPMEMTTTARKPFEKCSLDIVGPLVESSSDNKYVLIFQDELSKSMAAIPTERQDAETIATEFVLNIVLKLGTPRKILTNQESNFISTVFKETYKLLKIKKIECSAFYPESNESLERSHRVLAEQLRHYVQEDQSDWDTWIPYAIYVYTTTVHTSTVYTPFELVYGFKSEVPPALKETPSIREDYKLRTKSRDKS
jgi:hypothetical protein